MSYGACLAIINVFRLPLHYVTSSIQWVCLMHIHAVWTVFWRDLKTVSPIRRTFLEYIQCVKRFNLPDVLKLPLEEGSLPLRILGSGSLASGWLCAYLILFVLEMCPARRCTGSKSQNEWGWYHAPNTSWRD